MSDNNGNGVPSKDARPTSAPRVLEVLRVKPGDMFFARLLSEKYCGLFTHYYQKRSHVCKGEHCSSIIHKIDRTWKGYAAVEINSGKPNDRKWYPWVLEITEHLELDFRHRFKRGQTWELFCPAAVDRKRPGVEGKLWDVPTSATLPAAFNIVPTIQNLYHCFELDLSAKNPLPDRVYVEVSDDAPPQLFAEHPVETPEMKAKVAAEWEAHMKRVMNGKKSPATMAGAGR